MNADITSGVVGIHSIGSHQQGPKNRVDKKNDSQKKKKNKDQKKLTEFRAQSETIEPEKNDKDDDHVIDCLV